MDTTTHTTTHTDRTTSSRRARATHPIVTIPTEPTNRSVVAYQTACRSSSDRARAAFWRRLQAGVAAAYAIEFHEPKAEPEPAKPAAERWEQLSCFHCDGNMWRRAGEARMICRKCEKAGLAPFPTIAERAAKAAAAASTAPGEQAGLAPASADPGRAAIERIAAAPSWVEQVVEAQRESFRLQGIVIEPVAEVVA